MHANKLLISLKNSLDQYFETKAISAKTKTAVLCFKTKTAVS